MQDFVHQQYYSKRFGFKSLLPTWKHLQLAPVFPRLFNLPVPSWHHEVGSKIMKKLHQTMVVTPWKKCISPTVASLWRSFLGLLRHFCCQLVKKTIGVSRDRTPDGPCQSGRIWHESSHGVFGHSEGPGVVLRKSLDGLCPFPHMKSA